MVRAGAFSAVMTGLAGTAHAAAGGMVPGARVTAAALVAVGLLAWTGTRRERGLLGVLTGTAACQAGLHLVFGFAMATSCAAPTGGVRAAGHMGSMDAAGPAAPGTAAGCDPTTWAGLVAGHASGWMVLAHAGAAAGTALWLRRGERLAWRLLCLLPALTSPLLGLVRVVRGAMRCDEDLARGRHRTGLRAGAERDTGTAPTASPTADPLSRRGPPVPIAA